MVLDMARGSAQIRFASAPLRRCWCRAAPSSRIDRRSPSRSWSRRPPATFPSVGNEIAMRAISLLGQPYVWGGADLTGFDCSGLVRFIYDQVGIPVPRTAAEQYSAAKPIELEGLKPGDLLFFRTQGQRISHVAIYTGEGRFIHARAPGSPSSSACSTTSTTGRGWPAPAGCSELSAAPPATCLGFSPTFLRLAALRLRLCCRLPRSRPPGGSCARAPGCRPPTDRRASRCRRAGRARSPRSCAGCGA